MHAPVVRAPGRLTRWHEIRRYRWYYGLILPTILVLVAVNIYPLIYSVLVSLTNFKVNSFRGYKIVWMKNYLDLVVNPDFLRSMGYTSIFVACSVASELLLGVAIAMLLFRLDRAGNLLMSFFLLPMMLTPVIVGIMWRFMFNFDFGLINFFLEKLGLERVAFLSDRSRAIFYLCVVDLWQWSPYVVLLTYGSLQSLPRDQLESAAIDGAGPVKSFRYVTLPYLGQTIQICALIRIMDAIREYDKVYTMTNGGPGNATETVSFYIYRQAFKFMDTSAAAAASVILLIITIGISRQFVKGMRKREFKN
jgi:multiple sugar transport system permease protein